MTKIKKVFAREILDSRGNPTVEVELELESGITVTAGVPSGASTGTHEALEMRDGDAKRYHGLGVQKAVANVNGEIAENICGMEVFQQRAIDQKMLELDGTENKSRLGANAILGVSLAAARAAAMEKKIPLYQYINESYDLGITSYQLPIPMFNVVNGGAHSDSGLCIQEFKIVPFGIKTFREQLRAGSEVFHELKKILAGMEYSVGVGDEGGFAPKLESNSQALELINQAIEKAGYVPGKDVAIGLDSAASGFYSKEEDKYLLAPEGVSLERESMVTTYREWMEKYHIISIEDGLNEEDFSGWHQMKEKIGDEAMLIGDDLLVTNVKRVEMAIKEDACNAVLIKVNQIGTLTETIACMVLAKGNGMKRVMSHRSGETTDDFISDLAVGAGAEYMKSGSLSRGERLAKYNRLLRIEEEI